MDPTAKLKYEKSLNDAMTALGMFVRKARTRTMAPDTLAEEARCAKEKLCDLIKARKALRSAVDQHEHENRTRSLSTTAGDRETGNPPPTLPRTERLGAPQPTPDREPLRKGHARPRGLAGPLSAAKRPRHCATRVVTRAAPPTITPHFR